MGRDVGMRGHRINQLVGDLDGLDGGQPDASDAFDVRDRDQRISEVWPATAGVWSVGPDANAGDDDLFGTC